LPLRIIDALDLAFGSRAAWLVGFLLFVLVIVPRVH
jgi:hypothetical protein